MRDYSEKTPRNLAKRTHERLMDMAHNDELTQLLNRRGLVSMAEQVSKNLQREGLSASLTVTMLDMIGLKALNKKYTETGADRIIAESARAMSEHVRESDLVGRWGGDEFVIVSFDTDSDGTLKMLEKVKTNQPSEIDYNIVFRVFGSHVNVRNAINSVFENLEIIKKQLPHDETGRSVGKGVVLELS